MKTAKEIFDFHYRYYRDMLRQPLIPLEAREMIFKCMEEYANQKPEISDEIIKKFSSFINHHYSHSSMNYREELIKSFIEFLKLK